jgi:DNA-binding LacI/PurR family transcriptional regulator
MSRDNPSAEAGGASAAPLRVTARDVARAAGVSVAVVSYAFNRPQRVAVATRERVLATAAALGYPGPDPAARALRLGRTGVVAMLGPGPAELLLSDPATSLVARGLARACDRAGAALLLSGQPRAAADGTVLVGRSEWPAEGGRAVAVGNGPPGVPLVTADVGAGAAEVAAHLVDLGHRRLAVLTGPDGDRERLAGVRQGWGRAGPLRAYAAAGRARADGEVAARAALAAHPRPTALLALGDRLALGALDAAGHLGLEVPGGLSVAGLDDLPGSDAAGLTTVFVPYLPLGELAGDLLVALMSSGHAPVPPPLPTVLAIRRTTGVPAPD